MKELTSKLILGDFEVREPWRASNRAITIVVPIVSKRAGRREYVVLEEVKDKIKITDTGSIGHAQVKGDVDGPVFIRGGTMLKGATQERATEFGTVVFPQRSEKVPVHCIHATKAIRSGAIFYAAGHVPREVYSTILSEGNQGTTWQAVSNYSARMARAPSRPSTSRYVEEARTLIPHDDLLGVVEAVKEFRQELNEMLKRIPDYMNQVGVAIIDPEGVLGIELYDHPDSWKAFSDSILRSYSESVVREDKTGIFKPDTTGIMPAILAFLEHIQNAMENEVFNKNNARTVILKAEGYVGEYTELNGKTIHLSITRSEKDFARPFSIEWMATLNRIQAPRIYRGRPEPMMLYQSTSMHTPLNLRRKKITPVLLELRERAKTWTELAYKFKGSKATLASGLTELVQLGAVSKESYENGATRYALTGIGQELLKRKP